MSAIKLATPSSGSISLSPADTASNLTITVPAVTGTMLTTASTFAGTGPAFSVYSSAIQSISAATNTKVTLDVESFDTNNNFSSSRFTPTVAGYYQISYSIYYGSVFTFAIAKVFKNGSVISWSELYGGGTNTPNPTGTILVYMNGTTDYLELFAFSNNANTVAARSDLTYFSGSLVRAA